jgi:hypothetical protein
LVADTRLTAPPSRGCIGALRVVFQSSVFRWTGTGDIRLAVGFSLVLAHQQDDRALL